MLKLTLRAATMALVGVVAVQAAGAHAVPFQPFTPKAFAASEASGKSILIDVYAPWCPTCAAQQPTLSKIETSTQYKNLVVYRVDFDSQKDVLKTLGVQKQSTLIAFHGNTETDRSVGDTNAATIVALANSALK